jgi:hypothetical protein
VSVASAERRVARCKEMLRLAYEALGAEREHERKRKRSTRNRLLTDANEKMELFCLKFLASHPDEYGISKLPIRQRFAMCALASGMARPDIAAAMPKLSGKSSFVKMGITTSGLHGIIADARYALYRLDFRRVAAPSSA